MTGKHRRDVPAVTYGTTYVPRHRRVEIADQPSPRHLGKHTGEATVLRFGVPKHKRD